MAFEKLNIFLRRISTRRKYKDVVFRRVFQEKKDLLSLYNALNGTNYDNPNDLTITTLEDAIYMSMKNDLSFVISATINLYEHQSTINPNMPTRGLLYFTRVYEAYITINGLDLFSSKLVQLPTPQYIVFYNGDKDEPDEKILNLSDAFEEGIKLGIEPCLELKAKVLNINYGHNEKLLSECKKLYDYSYFINEVKKNIKAGMTRDAAIAKAIDTCIENDILREFLLKHRTEVMGMLLFTYDEKLHKKNEREIAKEEGRKEGRKEGIKEGRKEGIKEGIKEGREEMLLEVAKKYSQMTGVTIEEAIKIFSENDEN